MHLCTSAIVKCIFQARLDLNELVQSLHALCRRLLLFASSVVDQVDLGTTSTKLGVPNGCGWSLTGTNRGNGQIVAQLLDDLHVHFAIVLNNHVLCRLGSVLQGRRELVSWWYHRWGQYERTEGLKCAEFK